MEFELKVASGNIEYWQKKLIELGFEIECRPVKDWREDNQWFIKIPNIQSLIKILNEEDIIMSKVLYSDDDIYWIKIYDNYVD